MAVQRHDRDDDPAAGRRHTPAVDEQEHDEEERGDEAAGDESRAQVRRDRTAGPRAVDGPCLEPRRARSRTTRPAPGHEEDRLPAEELRQDPAGGRPERRADDAGRDPDAQRSLVAASICESRSSAAVTRSAAPTAWTQRAPDEHRERRREAADERRAANTTTPTPVGLARSPSRDVAARHGDERRARG
jgi:hypothetical protein